MLTSLAGVRNTDPVRLVAVTIRVLQNEDNRVLDPTSGRLIGSQGPGP